MVNTLMLRNMDGWFDGIMESKDARSRGHRGEGTLCFAGNAVPRWKTGPGFVPNAAGLRATDSIRCRGRRPSPESVLPKGLRLNLPVWTAQKGFLEMCAPRPSESAAIPLRGRHLS